MKLKINPYDSRTIYEAVSEISTYKTELEKKAKEFVRRLSEIGLQIASARFAMAEYDGNNDVSVFIEETAKGIHLVASGKAACFIEFGSGVAHGGGYPSEMIPPNIVGLGEYGKGHGATGKPWYYAHGKKSDGNPPAMAMLKARDAMIEQITQIAREVFYD